MMKVKAESLEKFSKDILMVQGASEERAEVVSECMIHANLRGVDSHGIRRLPVYVQRIEKGLVNPQGAVTISSDSKTITVLDGGLSFGEVVGKCACDIVVEKAKHYGTGIVTCKNTNHFGMAACYGLYLAEHNMISIIMSNANPSIAPWGGKAPLFGTNPLCITIPAKDRPHIVLDMAVSIVARGKIREAEEKGEKIPLTWAIGPNGTATDDPSEAIQGSLLPIGGPKGYGMALIIDVLSGILSGAQYSTGIRSMFDLSGPSGMGHLFLAIDIDRFLPADQFKRKIDEYIKTVKSSPKKDGVTDIYLPGELEYLSTIQRKKEGIFLPTKVLEKLRVLERTYLVTHLLPEHTDH
jgi:LDH2 family malate/lactate/ureidoglycolate dehydrogenase